MNSCACGASFTRRGLGLLSGELHSEEKCDVRRSVVIKKSEITHVNDVKPNDVLLLIVTGPDEVICVNSPGVTWQRSNKTTWHGVATIFGAVNPNILLADEMLKRELTKLIVDCGSNAWSTDAIEKVLMFRDAILLKVNT